AGGLGTGLVYSARECSGAFQYRGREIEAEGEGEGEAEAGAEDEDGRKADDGDKTSQTRQKHPSSFSSRLLAAMAWHLAWLGTSHGMVSGARTSGSQTCRRRCRAYAGGSHVPPSNQCQRVRLSTAARTAQARSLVKTSMPFMQADSNVVTGYVPSKDGLPPARLSRYRKSTRDITTWASRPDLLRSAK
ncbi:hypothetical protein E4U42_003647, partial [Claviceps africana]